MKKRSCDVVVLGGGPAGYVAAIRLAQLGVKVVLIEEKELGGVCMNIGCIPTKALLKTSETAAAINKSKEFGIVSSIESTNWHAAVDRKNRIVKNLNIGLEKLILSKEIMLLKGKGTLLSDRIIRVQTAEEIVEVTSNKIILTTGSAPMLPSIKGIDAEGVITSNEALCLEEIPQSMVIVGAGVIGLEFASMMNLLGTKVTVIELNDRILPNEDAEIASELLKIMKRQGITFKLSAEVTEIKETELGLEINYQLGDKNKVQACEKVLIAVGRKLNTDLFGSLPFHIEKSAIIVNESMETNIDGIYAAGDVTGGQLLAHLAFMEGKIAAENAMGLKSRINYKAVPSCIYTNPEIASVGMTESEALAAGIDVKVGRFNFRNNGRALTLGEREGFVKVIANDENVIIGGHILGVNASEMISELTLAITLKAKAGDLADMIHPHPSLSEAIWEACGDLLGRAIHSQ